jgi:hypothetical protein
MSSSADAVYGTYAIEPTGDPMTVPAHPGRMLFVSIPVSDPERSKAFFAELGFTFNPAFSDENGACMLVGEQAFVMLVGREKFAELSPLPTGDATTHALALFCFSVSSRDEVDAAPWPRSRPAAPRRTRSRISASCTREASSTSTDTAGR